ncbi:hypothetical protein Tco_0246712 [Tanacetum coccineum]
MSSMAKRHLVSFLNTHIQCIDRTDFDLGNNVILLYCLGKIMRNNMKAERTDVHQQVPKRARVPNDLLAKEKERFIQPNNDPLALVSDTSVQQYPTQPSKSPQSLTEPYLADNFQMDSGSSSTENMIETMVQEEIVVSRCVRGRYNWRTIKENHFRETMQEEMVVAGNVGGQNRGGIINPGQSKTHPSATTVPDLGQHSTRMSKGQADFQDSDYFKDKYELMQAKKSGAVLWMKNSSFFLQ